MTNTTQILQVHSNCRVLSLDGCKDLAFAGKELQVAEVLQEAFGSQEWLHAVIWILIFEVANIK